MERLLIIAGTVQQVVIIAIYDLKLVANQLIAKKCQEQQLAMIDKR